MTFLRPEPGGELPADQGADRGGQGSRRDNPTREGGDPHGLVHQGGEQTRQSRRCAHDRQLHHEEREKARREPPVRQWTFGLDGLLVLRLLAGSLFLDPDGDQERRRRQKRRRDPERSPDADQVGESAAEERPGRGGQEDDHLQRPEPRSRPLRRSRRRYEHRRRSDRTSQAPLQRLEGQQLPGASHEPHQADDDGSRNGRPEEHGLEPDAVAQPAPERRGERHRHGGGAVDHTGPRRRTPRVLHTERLHVDGHERQHEREPHRRSQLRDEQHDERQPSVYPQRLHAPPPAKRRKMGSPTFDCFYPRPPRRAALQPYVA